MTKDNLRDEKYQGPESPWVNEALNNNLVPADNTRHSLQKPTQETTEPPTIERKPLLENDYYGNGWAEAQRKRVATVLPEQPK